MSELRIDTTNLMADAVGDEHGVTAADEAWLAEECTRVHAEIDAARAAGGLEFFDLPQREESISECEALAADRRGRFEDLVVLGIGGSALGTIAVHRALAVPGSGTPRLHVLDNVDPEWIHRALTELDPKTTLVNVISKSGGTAETASQFLIFRNWLRSALGDAYRDHLVVTTDVEKGVLRKIARAEKLASLPVPDGVGGRFSVLTPVGLFPLAMTGVDIRGVLAGAAAMAERCSIGDPVANPAYRHGGLMHALERRKGKPIHVLMPYAQALLDLADWFRQLWAESLGKRLDRDGNEVFVGPTPVKALGATDQHSQLQLYAAGPFDKVLTFLGVDTFRDDVPIPNDYPEEEGFAYLGGKSLATLLDAERRGTAVALTEAKRPNSTIQFPTIDAGSVGEFLMLMEAQTAYVGGLLNIDAFDQPGVEASKIAAYALLGRKGYEQRRAEIEARLGGG